MVKNRLKMAAVGHHISSNPVRYHNTCTTAKIGDENGEKRGKSNNKLPTDSGRPRSVVIHVYFSKTNEIVTST